MRVGFDVTLSARVTTGVGVYAQQLQQALVARGIDLCRWEHPLGPAGQKWGRLANGARLAAWQSVGCARQAARDGVQVVHATAPIGPLRVARPVVMTIHDATTVTMPVQVGPADRLFQRVFAVDAARRADAILTPTHAAAADVIEHYGVPAPRVCVVPLGVGEAFRRTTADTATYVRAIYGLDRPYVLYVGADAPRKNLRRLVQAKAVERRLDDLDLVLAGPRGHHDAELDGLARAMGLQRPLRRLVDVPSGLMPGLYAGAACVAYVSLCEGFGLPIVEAMAAGAPVVTSNCSSMPEVAGDAALLVDPTDVTAIADAIGRAVYDGALAERLRHLGRRRSATFAWETTARLTEAVYRDVAGRPSSAGAADASDAADEQAWRVG